MAEAATITTLARTLAFKSIVTTFSKDLNRPEN